MVRVDEDVVVHRLRAAGCVWAEEEAAMILSAGGDVEGLVARRVAGEPLEYVVGWAEFCGLRIPVQPGVFVPRRRTEALVELAASEAPDARVVVDLCCGSGALGLAFAHRVPGVELHAADVDPTAVACARRNLTEWSRLAGLVPRPARPPGAGGDVDGHPARPPIRLAHQGDLFDALPMHLRGRVDVLLANVPYVPSDEIALLHREARDHEPLTTLDGGADGLALARRVADGAATWLAPGGRLFFEASDHQAPTLVDHLVRQGMHATVHGSVVMGTRTR